MIWVGFLYSMLRVIQLQGLFWMSGSKNRSLRRRFNLHSRPWLRVLLRAELILWSINALGLTWHILGVFRQFTLIAPL